MFRPRVTDISHYNRVGGNGPTEDGFTRAMNAGIWGVIHKASQGRSYVDNKYHMRRKAAQSLGLLWGAYHFNDGTSVAAQVSHFISVATPDANTLMALDYENNPRSNMSIHQAVEFLRLLEEKLGRKGVIYSGNRLKEQIGRLDQGDFEYITSHRLWLAQYGSHAHLPRGFNDYFLWQYTGDGVGPTPHLVPGIDIPGNRGIDLNAYRSPAGGTKEELEAEWA